MAHARRHRVRYLFLGLLASSLLVVAGCDESYDAELLYPLRKDWVVKNPDATREGLPKRINPPGIFPSAILDGKSGMEETAADLLKERETGEILDPRPTLENPKAVVDLMLALRDLGGRPRNPKIDVGDDAVNGRFESELKMDRKTLTKGSVLYRRNCLHCHGLNGDGRGPTGAWINPHPRDFRSGIFKYTSSGQQSGERKPLRDDLRRILVNGIEGSAMPSFRLMSPEEHEALISYVIHLSVRGEAEGETMKELIAPTESGGDPTPVYMQTRKWGKLAAERWLAAPAAELKPNPATVPDYKSDKERLEAAARGHDFFIRPDQCAKCHVNFGRDSDYRWDGWATIVRPRNFYSNVFGGGRRPIDLFYRIHGGIRGSGMPAIAEIPDKEKVIWDLVAFIQVLPYPEERAKLRKLERGPGLPKILLD